MRERHEERRRGDRYEEREAHAVRISLGHLIEPTLGDQLGERRERRRLQGQHEDPLRKSQRRMAHEK